MDINMDGIITRLDYRVGEGVIELDESIFDQSFKDEIKQCIDAQKTAAKEIISSFKPESVAKTKVSPDALARILEQKRDVHGISRDKNISNVITFGAAHIDDSVINDEVFSLRKNVDQRMHMIARKIFPRESGLTIVSSGHFWYPPGAYMGWHTNSGAPGWRGYINYAEEAGKSFFRYRDPSTGEIVTLMDREWNIRIFRIDNEIPLWHAVYSETNRFSIGYMIYKRSYYSRILKRVQRLFGR